MTDPRTPSQAFVQDHRDKLMHALKHGNETIRAIAFAILLEGGENADVELVERELELYKEESDLWP